MPTDRGAAALPARYVAVLCDILEGRGIERGELLGEARIRSVDAPGAQVALGKLEALLAAAERRSDRRDLGFDLGRRLDPTSHDVIGFALLTSPTLGDMLRMAVTYQRLMQPFFAVSLQRSADRAELVYVPAVPLTSRAMRVFEEAILVANDSSFRTTLGARVPEYEVWMSIERPGHAGRYEELRPGRVHFGEATPGLRIALPVAALERPLAMANPRAMRAAEERCKALLGRTRVRRRWTEWCRTMLRESEDARPTLADLARFVNLSSRTLGRYLEDEGTGFRALSLQVRTEKARRLLASGELSVTQVAYRLGYTDVASFVRSFRAQTGRTPGALRGRPDGRVSPRRTGSSARRRGSGRSP